MPARLPTADGPASGVSSRHRTMLGAHTVPTATSRFSDDDMLLLLLISTWELHTARKASPCPLAEMTRDELIEYWSDPSDDPCPPGCPAPHHPAPAATPRSRRR